MRVPLHRLCCRLPALLPGMLLLLLLVGCFTDVQERQTQAFEQADAGRACSIQGQNRRVQNIMQAWYLYVDDMPSRDPANFDSPQAMLNALRVNPPDRFSFLADREATLSFTEEGRRIGIGVSLILRAEPDDYRVVDVIEGAPADEAGMERGDLLLSINGRSVADWFFSEGLGAAFGPDEEGVEVSLSARRPDGEEYAVTLEKREFGVDPVTALTFFQLDDERNAAYFMFRSFIEPARERLDELFGELRAAEVDELILDMRYNGGGRIAVAEQLGGQIGGSELAGEVFVELVHNEARSANNVTRTFNEESNALALDRLVVIGSGRTASASELIINNLRPFMQVDVIGARTFGKPVGSYGFDVCELLLFPTAFSLSNADGEADYFDGLAPSCPAGDGIESALGDPGEASLAQALHFLNTGECDAEAARLARQGAAEQYRPEAGGREGWHPRTGVIR